MKAMGQALSIQAFHDQWRIDRHKVLPPIDPILLYKDPITVRSRYKSIGSATRVPSQFELVRADNSLPPPQKGKESSRKKRRTNRAIAEAAAASAELSEPSSSMPAAPLTVDIEFGEADEVFNFAPASRLVNWEYVVEQLPQWAMDIANQYAFCPDPASAKNGPYEEHFESQEDAVLPDDIAVARECRELRRFVLDSCAKRYYGYPSLWCPSAGDRVDIITDRQLILQEREDRMRERHGLPPPPEDDDFRYPLLPSLEIRILRERAHLPALPSITALTEAVQAVASTIGPQQQEIEPEQAVVDVVDVQRRSARGMVPRKRRYGDV
jgi:hypothetical protein